MKNYQDLSNEELKKLTNAYIDEWVDISHLAKALCTSNYAAYDVQNSYGNDKYYLDINPSNIDIWDMKDSVSHACRKSVFIVDQIRYELTKIFTVLCNREDKNILGFTLPSVFNGDSSLVYDEFFAYIEQRMPDTVSNPGTFSTVSQKNEYLFTDTAQKVIEDFLPIWEKNISIDKAAKETEDVKE